MADEHTPAVRGARFSGGPARSFLSSLAADARLFDADIAVDEAHVVMLAETEIIAAETAGAILTALADVAEAGHGALPDGEDVHEAIETAVIEAVGPDGGRMHTARSRNDEVATCLRMATREALLQTHAAAIDLGAALVGLAAAHTETVMPGYTHLQPAQPTTLAHWALSYAQALERDRARLLDAYGRTNRSPLGAAAFAGTPFPIDRARTAALLGFDGVCANSMDAVSTRDFMLEAVSAMGQTVATAAGIATDLIGAAGRGHITIADAYASTSSIMPQKVNPDSLELVRAAAGSIQGAQTAIAAIITGLPRAYNRDLQTATTHLWTAVDATEAVDVAAGAVATVRVDTAAMAAAADAGFSTATGVADTLAMAGIPFREAHHIVAEVAAATDAPDVATIMDAVDSAAPTHAAAVDEAAIAAALDPQASVAARASQGGPAAAETEPALEAAEAALGDARSAAATHADAIAAAAAERAAAVASLTTAGET
jgi:argininosuccinate lyase (EC 4.3.2.1)